MIEELKRRNWPNDTQHRAKLIKELGVQAYKAYRDNGGRSGPKPIHELLNIDALTGETLTAEYERLRRVADNLNAQDEIIERRLEEIDWLLPDSYKYLGDTPVVEIGGPAQGAPA